MIISNNGCSVIHSWSFKFVSVKSTNTRSTRHHEQPHGSNTGAVAFCSASSATVVAESIAASSKFMGMNPRSIVLSLKKKKKPQKKVLKKQRCTRIYTCCWIANEVQSVSAPFTDSLSPLRDLVYLHHRMKQNGTRLGAHQRHILKSDIELRTWMKKMKLIYVYS